MKKHSATRLWRNLTGLFLITLLPTAAWAVDTTEIGALIAKESYQEALQAIEAGQQEPGADFDSLELLKGAVLVRMGELDQGMLVFQALQATHPNDAAILNNIGVIHAERGELYEARNAFERALEISPDYQQALYNLGDIYGELACRTYGKISDPESAKVPSYCESVAGSQAGGSGGQARSGYQPGAAALPEPMRQALQATLEAWRSAWSEQDVEGYLAHYSQLFEPDGLSLEAWRNKRRSALKRPEWIRVEISNTRMNAVDGQATIRFRQHYSASNYRDQVTKQLLLRKEGSAWKIVREQVF